MTPTTSNPNFDKEKPEGSRETVDEALGAGAGYRRPLRSDAVID